MKMPETLQRRWNSLLPREKTLVQVTAAVLTGATRSEFLRRSAEAGLAAWSLAEYAAGRRAALPALAGSEDEELFERADRRYSRGLLFQDVLHLGALQKRPDASAVQLDTHFIHSAPP